MTTSTPTDAGAPVQAGTTGGSGEGDDLPGYRPRRTPTGERARRRRQLRRRRRRRLLFRLVVAFLVLALGGVGAATLLTQDDDGSDGAAVPTAPPRSAPTAAPPRTLLLVQQDEEGKAVSLTLLSTNPARGTGMILLIPRGAMTEVPAYGLEALGQSLSLGGIALLQATVENLLGVGVDDVLAVNEVQLTELMTASGDLVVRVPERVEEVGRDGRVNVLWERGESVVEPDEVASLLAAKGEGTDLGRLARHQAFWEAWLAHLGVDAGARSALESHAPLGRMVPDLLGGSVDIEMLPVEAIDAGQDDGEELYRVRDDELEALVRRALPGAVSLQSSSRIRVQILNGTGQVGLAQHVTVRLVQPPTRARVLFTGNAERFDHDVTEVVFYDRKKQGAAEEIRRTLGLGRLVFSRRPLGVVDVTVVVGSDFPVPAPGSPAA